MAEKDEEEEKKEVRDFCQQETLFAKVEEKKEIEERASNTLRNGEGKRGKKEEERATRQWTVSTFRHPKSRTKTNPRLSRDVRSLDRV